MARSKTPATFIAIVGGNDLYWRVEAPAKAIGAKTLIIEESEATRVFMEPNNDRKSGFRWKPVEDGYATYPDVKGTVVWTRPDPIRAVHGDAMRHLGHTIVGEVDDNYIADPRLNIFTRVNRYTVEDQQHHLNAMAAQDRIVFSTVWLRDRYWKTMKKKFKGYRLPELHVCMNNVDAKDWPKPIERDGPLRVTWMGSPSHIWDLDLAWPALLHARNLGCQPWLVGYDPTKPEVWPDHPRAVHKLNQWRKVQHRHTPWVTPKDYHRVGIPADIGLCPLLYNDSTMGKSDVKFLEYTMSGAAVIAQNNSVYNRTIIHGETGLLVGGPGEMLNAVTLLVKDKKLRETLVTNAQQYVREERGLKQLRKEWGEAIA